MKRTPSRLYTHIVCIVLLLALPLPAANDTPLERGRRIYYGTPLAGDSKVMAQLPNLADPVDARPFACIQCHGEHGRGLSEGGVQASDIRWAALTKPYGLRHGSEREHPAYTKRSLIRAISMGIDPAGNRLHPLMPRYNMSSTDMEALIQFLQTLDTGQQMDSALVLVGAVYESGVHAARSAAAFRAMELYLREYLPHGLYDRPIRLDKLVLPEVPADCPARWRSYLDTHSPVLVFAPPVCSTPDSLAGLCAEYQVPLFGMEMNDAAPAGNDWVFRPLPGVSELGRAMLADHKAGHKHSRPLLVYAPEYSAGAALLHSYCAGSFSRGAVMLRADTCSIEMLLRLRRREGADCVLLLMQRSGQSRYVQEIRRAHSDTITLLLPLDEGAKVCGNYPGEFHDVYAPGVQIGIAAIAANEKARAAHAFFARDSAAGLMQETFAADMLYAAAALDIVTEQLKNCGRDCSPRALRAILESLYRYERGLLPPLTFGPRRAIGGECMYIVTPDSNGTIRSVRLRSL